MVRYPSIKVRIGDLLKGDFYPGDPEEKKPSYVVTRLGEKVVRASICGFIVDKFVNSLGNYGYLSINDDTGSIKCKFFYDDVENVEKYEIGDLVHVIGKIREFNDERYINTEIIKKVDDDFFVLHRLEIIQRISKKDKILSKIISILSENDSEDVREYIMKEFEIDEEVLEAILKNRIETIDHKSLILKFLEEIDEGEGVQVSKLFEMLNLSEREIEEAIDELLEEGKIYEPKPGVLKVIK